MHNEGFKKTTRNCLIAVQISLLTLHGCGGTSGMAAITDSQNSYVGAAKSAVANVATLQPADSIVAPQGNATSEKTNSALSSEVQSPVQSTSAPGLSTPTQGNANSLAINTKLSELILDSRTIGLPSAGFYPEKGIAIQDPVTGLYNTRATTASELKNDYLNNIATQSLIVYSRYSPDNSSGELFLVHGANSTSAWVFRRSDNKMIAALKFKVGAGSNGRSLGEVNELRWDYTGAHPGRVYFVGRSLPKSQAVANENPDMSFYYTDIDIATGVQSNPILIRDFSNDFPSFSGGTIMNDVEGDSSIDSRYWAWQVMNPLGSGFLTYGVFTYDKDNNRILGKLQRACANESVPCVSIDTPSQPYPYITRPNMVEFSPLGTRVVVHFERVYPGYGRDIEMNTISDGPKAFYPNFTDPIRIGADATHSGWAWGKNGEELFVSQNNRNDWIEAVDIANSASAKCTLIGSSGNSYSCGTKVVSQPQLDPSYSIGFHFGKIYDRSKRNWLFISTYGAGATVWSRNQFMLVKIEDASGTARPTFLRLGSSINLWYDYRSEGSGALGFKSDTIWSTGNWGFTDGRAEVVRIDLPSNLFSVLP
jgi:hypothetical protein